MTTTVLAAVLAVVLLPLGVAKLAAVPAMRRAATHLGMTTPRYRLLGALEVAAVAALLTDHHFPVLGIAAATGLVLLMAGAVTVHLRHGDPVSRCLPALVLGALAAVDLALTAGA